MEDARERRRGRSIPTCVGNTTVWGWRRRRASVHPHVRGEYGSWMIPDSLGDGPSPRAWGILIEARRECAGRRSIPTCVGNTLEYVRIRVPVTVHPHVRGEYHNPAAMSSAMRGPSPRAWGIP